ncbi:hypothetical protein AVEN_25342-1 [Araneus ventricosus]|uniref:Uncharacterized protein n=1 Tax=Araneus ventricosus TaxID=182803 RepID=A0A4Y2EI04_ARAVE|nr:hypothetical protein AVEN_25342-1 [Araneus ventricosus]
MFNRVGEDGLGIGLFSPFLEGGGLVVRPASLIYSPRLAGRMPVRGSERVKLLQRGPEKDRSSHVSEWGFYWLELQIQAVRVGCNYLKSWLHTLHFFRGLVGS